MIIPGLIPLFKHQFGDDIEKCFTPLAMEIMRSAHCDPDTGELITMMEAHITKVAESDMDLDLSEEEAVLPQHHQRTPICTSPAQI